MFREWLRKPLWGYKRPQVLRSLLAIAVLSTDLSLRFALDDGAPRIRFSALQAQVDREDKWFEGPVRSARLGSDTQFSSYSTQFIALPQFHLTEAATGGPAALHGRLVCGKHYLDVDKRETFILFGGLERGVPRDCWLTLDTGMSLRHTLIGEGAVFSADVKGANLTLRATRRGELDAAWMATSSEIAEAAPSGYAGARAGDVFKSLVDARFSVGDRQLSLGDPFDRAVQRWILGGPASITSDWLAMIEDGAPAQFSVGWPISDAGDGPLIGACPSGYRSEVFQYELFSSPDAVRDRGGCWIPYDPTLRRMSIRCDGKDPCASNHLQSAEIAANVHRFDGPAQALLLRLFARAAGGGAHPPLPQTPELLALRAQVFDDYAVVMGWEEAGARGMDKAAVTAALGRQPHLWRLYHRRGKLAGEVRRELMQDFADLGLGRPG